MDSDSTTEQSIADFITPWLKDVGIEVKAEASDSDTISEKTTNGDYDMTISGWSLGPDPDYQLGINTCASRPEADGSGPTTQDGYCNPEFDKLVEQQHTELDHDKRAELVRQALAINYQDVPNITLWYPDQLEAYRSDRFTGFTKMPEDGGIIASQSGYWGFQSIEPVSTTESSATSGSTAWIWGVGGVAVVGIAAAFVVRARRSHTAEERE